jgi:two-component system, NtrC family, C4-dicarboxylate transport sensor histidine kinase DctB
VSNMLSIGHDSHRRQRWLRHWPLLMMVVGVALVDVSSRLWMHRRLEFVDANDLAMREVADTALGMATACALLVALIAHAMLNRQRVQMEKELSLARTAIHDQNEKESQDRRSRTLAALAGGLAHELGQPLSAARVGIEGLHYLRQLGREPTSEQIATTLSRVGICILTMTQTIEHLRQLAGSTDGVKLSRIDLAELITALLADRDQWLRYHDTPIEFTRPDSAIYAMGDVAGVRMVLSNLLRNAVEAVSGQSQERRLVKITAGPGAFVAVHDSGPGIPEELQGRLFDPFFSTKDGNMRGIGLSLARASMQRMGGELRVTSQLGSGSTFSVHLISPEQHQTIESESPS